LGKRDLLTLADLRYAGFRVQGLGWKWVRERQDAGRRMREGGCGGVGVGVGVGASLIVRVALSCILGCFNRLCVCVYVCVCERE
jgi:hypothetical protein